MQQAVISVAALTDIGRKRRTNQDSWLAERGVYMVCDGMGGESGGERASAIAVEELAQLAREATRTRASIEETLERAQSRTRALGLTLGGIAGTTVTGVVLPQWFAAADARRDGDTTASADVATADELECGCADGATHFADAHRKPTATHHPKHSAQYNAIATLGAIDELRPLSGFGDDWDATQPGADALGAAVDDMAGGAQAAATAAAADATSDMARFGEHRADIAPDAWSIAIRQLLPDAEPHMCYVVNVGDSRTYHMNLGFDGHWDAASLTQITHDHSRRQEAIESGEMTPEEAERSIARNVITQCIGSPMGIRPDLFMADAAGRFIICSDGCHGEIDDATIAHVAAQHDMADAAARALIDASLAAGGGDNVTVIVVDMPWDATRTEAWHCERLEIDEDLSDIDDATVQT